MARPVPHRAASEILDGPLYCRVGRYWRGGCDFSSTISSCPLHPQKGLALQLLSGLECRSLVLRQGGLFKWFMTVETMRHYEIVFLVHLDQGGQVPAMIDRYRSIIAAGEGVLHRLEDWKQRVLAYPIQKMHKAHYVLMNVECSRDTLAQLDHAFRFNDAVLRSLIVRMEHAVTEPSPLNRTGGREASSTKHEQPEQVSAAPSPTPDQTQDEAASPQSPEEDSEGVVEPEQTTTEKP